MLYTFLALILIIGAAIFFLRLQVIDFIGNVTLAPIADILNQPVKTTNTEALDLKILADKRFVNLKNQVVNFDFDNFDKNGAVGADNNDSNDIIVTSLEASTSLETATGTGEIASTTLGTSTSQLVKIRVEVGNNSPFFKKAK